LQILTHERILPYRRGNVKGSGWLLAIFGLTANSTKKIRRNKDVKVKKQSPAFCAFRAFVVKFLVSGIISHTGGFPKTSDLGKAPLDLWEKAGFRPLFQEHFTKLARVL
jgi:hypothetical protein